MADSPGRNVTHPILIVTGGPRDGDILLINEPGLARRLGSGLDADMRIEAANVDAIHAAVEWRAKGLTIGDQGSSTGTYVNGERIGDSHVLQDGDRICLGPPGSRHSVKLLVRVPDVLPEPVIPEPVPDIEPKALVEVFATPPPPVPTTPPAGTPAAAPPDPPPTLPLGYAPAVVDEIQFEETPPLIPAHEQAAVFVAPADEEPPPRETAPQPRPFDQAAPPALPLVPPPTAKPLVKRTEALVTEAPSIGDDRVREPLEFPPTEEPKRPRRKATAGLRHAGLRIPRPLFIAGATAIVGIGGFLLYGFFAAPPPVLSSVTPPKAEPGGTITLNGSGFAGTPGANVVRLGEQIASVTSATETQLVAFVPENIALDKPLDATVTVETRRGRSNALTVKVRRLPRITSIEPPVALPGFEITLKGQDLEGTPLLVQMDGQAAEVREARSDVVRTVVPVMPLVEGRGVRVTVQAAGDTSRPATLILGRLPLLSSVQPSAGQAGDRVVLKGFGFDPDPAGNAVEFGNEPALVLGASESEVVVAAPLLQAAGTVQVVLRARGGTSSGATSFTLSRSTGGVFVPRFFPAPAGEVKGRAAVATEMGPVLLLGGKDDAASVAERAARSATALNAAFAAEGTGFELRETPQVGVAMTGKAGLLIRATNDDVAAYGSNKGSRGNPRALAAYWTAILQDLHALFVRRQRPTKVIELSPRGKVLLEIFSESERRSGPGAGVAASIVNPPAPSLAAAFRDMTTTLPEGPGSAAAAVTGQWVGTVNEAGVERPLRLAIGLQGGKLVGTLSTKVGEVSMDTPMNEVAYEKGTLSFSTSSGPALRKFRGSIQGSEISGTVVGPAGQDVGGRFRLRYAE